MQPLNLPSSALLAAFFLFAPLLAGQYTRADRRHEDPQWKAAAAHLPDPTIAPASLLEQQADLLRVRKFPEDALEYYNYALKRGGRTAILLDKIGLTQLELRNVILAQAFFRQAIKADKKSPQGWNNLAATEYLERQYGAAVGDYKKAVKLDRHNAVYHANLSTAYFEAKNLKGARKEADEALKLDPLVFQHSSGAGVAAHILSVEDRARFAFEMAKLYAQHGQEAEMLHALGVACENGMNIAAAMAKEATLAKYRDDPRVALVIENAKELHGGAPTVVASASGLKPEGSPEAHDR